MRDEDARTPGGWFLAARLPDEVQPLQPARGIQATLVALNAASWWDTTTLQVGDLPEYLHLAPILEDEPKIRSWLRAEMSAAQTTRYPNCPGQPRNDWPQHIPEPGPLRTG
jgi:hypothetical protein